MAKAWGVRPVLVYPQQIYLYIIGSSLTSLKLCTVRCLCLSKEPILIRFRKVLASFENNPLAWSWLALNSRKFCPFVRKHLQQKTSAY